MQSELLQLKKVIPKAIRAILRHEIFVLITNADDDLLNACGLKSRCRQAGMANPLTRYKAAGIELVKLEDKA
jgi:hypothetical protein